MKKQIFRYRAFNIFKDKEGQISIQTEGKNKIVSHTIPFPCIYIKLTCIALKYPAIAIILIKLIFAPTFAPIESHLKVELISSEGEATCL